MFKRNLQLPPVFANDYSLTIFKLTKHQIIETIYLTTIFESNNLLSLYSFKNQC